MSNTVTRAPMPAATLAALAPTVPPPMINTCAGSTPGTPASSTPRPPWLRSRHFAPSCTAILPATSLIGVRAGWRPSDVCIVSQATATAPDSRTASVNARDAAKWK